MNVKALGALGLGIFAIANAALLVAPFVLPYETISVIEPLWMVCGFLSLFLGAAAISLGSLGWLDANRGMVSGGRVGSATAIVLGGLSTLIPLATVAYVIWLLFQVANTMADFD